MSGTVEPDGPSDEELLARYLAPTSAPDLRQAAFHQLVDRHHRRVFAVCLHALGSPSDAEDAVQETFLKLARHADGFRAEAKLSTWLYRVARNVCTDHVRHDARRPSTPVADPSTLDQAPHEADRTGGTDDTLAMRAALDQLDPASRQALLLVAVEGLSYQEAGAALDLAVGTVKSRVSRARVRLATLLADADADADAGTGDGDRARTSDPDRGDATLPRPDTSHP